MRKRLIIWIVFLFVCSSVPVYIAVASFSKPRIISPLPQKVYPTPTPTNTPTPTPIPPTPTETPTPTPAPVTAPEYLESLLLKYSNEYSIDSQLLKRIAKCESGFGTGASFNNGLYAGLFQFSEVLWRQTRTLIGLDPNPDLRYSGEESIRTAAFMLSQGHLGIWPNCGY